jgi:alkylation response protein AidB-like acyl-CoA dehydrogenase
MLGRTAGDAARDRPTNAKLTLSFDDVLELAHGYGRTGDAHVRQELARLYTDTQTGRWNALRARAEARTGGGQSVASVGKLTQTAIVKRAAALATSIAGAQGMLADADGAEAGVVAKAMVFSPASSIYGGADEIQRNIASERTLGLPREPAPDRDRPYGEVLRERAAPR